MAKEKEEKTKRGQESHGAPSCLFLPLAARIFPSFFSIYEKGFFCSTPHQSNLHSFTEQSSSSLSSSLFSLFCLSLYPWAGLSLLYCLLSAEVRSVNCFFFAPHEGQGDSRIAWGRLYLDGMPFLFEN